MFDLRKPLDSLRKEIEKNFPRTDEHMALKFSFEDKTFFNLDNCIEYKAAKAEISPEMLKKCDTDVAVLDFVEVSSDLYFSGVESPFPSFSFMISFRSKHPVTGKIHHSASEIEESEYCEHCEQTEITLLKMFYKFYGYRINNKNCVALASESFENQANDIPSKDHLIEFACTLLTENTAFLALYDLLPDTYMIKESSLIT